LGRLGLLVADGGGGDDRGVGEGWWWLWVAREVAEKRWKFEHRNTQDSRGLIWRVG